MKGGAPLLDDLFVLLAEARSEGHSEVAEEALRGVFAASADEDVRRLFDEGTLAMSRRDWRTVDQIFGPPQSSPSQASQASPSQASQSQASSSSSQPSSGVQPSSARQLEKQPFSSLYSSSFGGVGVRNIASLDPGFYEAGNRYATALFLRGRVRPALEASRKVLDAEPRSVIQSFIQSCTHSASQLFVGSSTTKARAAHACSSLLAGSLSSCLPLFRSLLFLFSLVSFPRAHYLRTAFPCLLFPSSSSHLPISLHRRHDDSSLARGRHFGALGGVALCEDAIFSDDEAPPGAKQKQKAREHVARCFQDAIDVLPWSSSWWQLEKYRK